MDSDWLPNCVGVTESTWLLLLLLIGLLFKTGLELLAEDGIFPGVGVSPWSNALGIPKKALKSTGAADNYCS